jgi:Rps23 Pro-64 3,4-dihydroxylase Tpa1-like proline 4-hydroxylase
MTPTFALNPRTDTAALKAEFTRFGVLSIPDILTPETADWLHSLLRSREDWKQSIASGNSLVELDRPTRAAMTPQQKADLDNAVYGSARQQFQFRYETLRVPDDDAGRAASSDPLAAFARWWSHGEPRDFLREVMSLPQIDFADLQATAYSPGDFLTGHTDDVDGKGRLAAYVLNLTPKWAVEWGGMLAFHDEAANRVLALPPAFNRLNLFKVPRLHSVTEVTRIAPYRRYALTGWLRQGQP